MLRGRTRSYTQLRAGVDNPCRRDQQERDGCDGQNGHGRGKSVEMNTFGDSFSHVQYPI
jgi:hypothetical protein